MARLLIIYYAEPGQSAPGQSLHRSHKSSISSFARYTPHECIYFNAARGRMPHYMAEMNPDLVIFHVTFIQRRIWPETFSRITAMTDAVRHLPAIKVLVTSDESWFTDQLVKFVRDFEISHVFTFASPEAQRVIYEGLDPEAVGLHLVLSDYIDERTLRHVNRLRRRNPERTRDVAARLPTDFRLGRHGQQRVRLAQEFSRLSEEAGWVSDISNVYEDYIQGDDWYRFLLGSRYVLGNETGSSVVDRDGSMLACLTLYLQTHEAPTFEEVEAACFPGQDGNLDYRCLAPRHLEAVMTRTCQVLIEGDYGGVLVAGEHYVPVKPDFSNLEDVVAEMQDENRRQQMVERAYRDVVESGRYTYECYANYVLDRSWSGQEPSSGARPGPRTLWNRIDNAIWPLYPSEAIRIARSGPMRARYAEWRTSVRTVGQHSGRWATAVRVGARRAVGTVLGEDRVRAILSRVRRDTTRPNDAP